MTEQEFQRAKAICAEATPEPWRSLRVGTGEDGNGLFVIWPDVAVKNRHNRIADVKGASNSEFVVKARSLLPKAMAEIDQLQADLARWKRAVEGLTPSGSEFVNDPEACAAHIRERTRWPSITVQWKERAERAETELQRLRAVGICGDMTFGDLADAIHTEATNRARLATFQRCAEIADEEAEILCSHGFQGGGQIAAAIRREFGPDAAGGNPAP